MHYAYSCLRSRSMNKKKKKKTEKHAGSYETTYVTKSSYIVEIVCNIKEESNKQLPTTHPTEKKLNCSELDTKNSFHTRGDTKNSYTLFIIDRVISLLTRNVISGT